MTVASSIAVHRVRTQLVTLIEQLQGKQKAAEQRCANKIKEVTVKNVTEAKQRGFDTTADTESASIEIQQKCFHAETREKVVQLELCRVTQELEESKMTCKQLTITIEDLEKSLNTLKQQLQRERLTSQVINEIESIINNISQRHLDVEDKVKLCLEQNFASKAEIKQLKQNEKESILLFETLRKRHTSSIDKIVLLENQLSSAQKHVCHLKKSLSASKEEISRSQKEVHNLRKMLEDAKILVSNSDATVQILEAALSELTDKNLAIVAASQSYESDFTLKIAEFTKKEKQMLESLETIRKNRKNCRKEPSVNINTECTGDSCCEIIRNSSNKSSCDRTTTSSNCEKQSCKELSKTIVELNIIETRIDESVGNNCPVQSSVDNDQEVTVESLVDNDQEVTVESRFKTPTDYINCTSSSNKTVQMKKSLQRVKQNKRKLSKEMVNVQNDPCKRNRIL